MLECLFDKDVMPLYTLCQLTSIFEVAIEKHFRTDELTFLICASNIIKQTIFPKDI
jgi:hypothetical protein